MKAKEEAEKLIEQFMKPIDKLHNYPMCFDTAKQCAIIAVDRIISVQCDYYPNDLGYWEEVYIEIEKL